MTATASSIESESAFHSGLPPVVIFDSGVGGLSILEAISQALPWLPLVYCSDNAAFPYGTKSEDEVSERTSLCLNQLQRAFKPAALVIACNTASTVALPRVRHELKTPIVGVVPAIKTAASLSHNHAIALLATPGTVVRPYTEQLIQDFASHCKVLRIGSSELVHQAERKLRQQKVSRAALARELAPLFEDHYPRVDQLILGCTHFPLLREEIGALLSAAPHPIGLVDSGAAIARRVAFLLQEQGLQGERPAHDHLALFTRHDPALEALYPALHQRHLHRIGLLQPSKNQPWITLHN